MLLTLISDLFNVIDISCTWYVIFYAYFIETIGPPLFQKSLFFSPLSKHEAHSFSLPFLTSQNNMLKLIVVSILVVTAEKITKDLQSHANEADESDALNYDKQ